MLLNVMKKDLQKNKTIAITLFIFLMLSALLITAGTRMIMELDGAVQNLFKKSGAPHFVQMHTGEISLSALEAFAAEQPLVKAMQVVETLNINGANIFLHHNTVSEKNSVMDLNFVVQNSTFDFLLNLNDQIVDVSAGEIAVPVYYMQEAQLKIGDKVRISSETFQKELTIVVFVRDAMMNPAMVSSKRFVLHQADYAALKSQLGEPEYLIEFQLTDPSKVNAFSNTYRDADLPQKGPAVTYNLMRMLNALSDGTAAIIVILTGGTLIVIAFLCLWLVLHTTLEEAQREIGIMKALGLSHRSIRKIYLTKFTFLSISASIAGYLLAVPFTRLFTANSILYMGAAERNVYYWIFPLLATSIVSLFVISFCRFVFSRAKRITAIEALQSSSFSKNMRKHNRCTLHKTGWCNVNLFLGARCLIDRPHIYSSLCLIYILCSFIIAVPANFLNTMQSPDFIKYLGIGRSDMRIDLQQAEDPEKQFNDLIAYIKSDTSIHKFSPLITSRVSALSNHGVYETIHVETGDFSIFPIEYLAGRAPIGAHEISLSYLNAQDMNKTIGDTLFILANGRAYELRVCGIYQDVTNGGKTAKAMVPHDPKHALWYVIYLDVKPDVSIESKISEYTQGFSFAKITGVDNYLLQTLGTMISRIALIATLSFLASACIAVLITALFLKMLLAKDDPEIAVMRHLGFSYRNLQVQYMAQILPVLGIGIVIGTVLANTAGQSLLSAMASFIGASRITFVIDPLLAYIFTPSLLTVLVAGASLASLVPIRNRRF